MSISVRTRLGAAPLATLLLLTGCATAREPGGPSAPTSIGASPSRTPNPAPSGDEVLRPALLRLEQRFGARLGVHAVDTGSGRRVAYRAGERFPFASANKVLVAAAVLHHASDRDLDEVVRYSRTDLLAYAPVTGRHVQDGMTVRALIDAALRYSDNTAANLLVERLGGPPSVQRFLRSIGDRTTSVDRAEPELNTAVPADPRDTTTPRAFAADLEQVLLGSVLPAGRRHLLESTLRRSTTGDRYIRAGAPAGWTVADKTGSGAYGVRNDIAVVRPPHRAPIVLVLLSTRRERLATSDDALLAEATRTVLDVLR